MCWHLVLGCYVLLSIFIFQLTSFYKNSKIYLVEGSEFVEHLYVDESGSMTYEHSDSFKFFIIGTVRVKNIDKLKRKYKRFVSKYYENLKELNKGKMFTHGKFLELKGCELDFEMKKKFVEYFCDPELLEVIYIKIDNRMVKSHLYENTARAFNFVYQLMLMFCLKNGKLPKDSYHIQLDERNQKTECKASLEDYLNTQLYLANELTDKIEVEYFDSCNNKLIQIADVFANIYYSYCLHPQRYNELIKHINNKKCLKTIFKFPFK